MKNIIVIYILASMLFALRVDAQVKENLIPNGALEQTEEKFEDEEDELPPDEGEEGGEDEEEKPPRIGFWGWVVQKDLSEEVVEGKRDGGTGTKILKVSATDGQFVLYESISSRKPIFFKRYDAPLKHYNLSFWANPSKAGYAVDVTVRIYKAGTLYTQDPKSATKVFTLTPGWKKYEFDFEVPAGYTQGNMEVTINNGDKAGNILFDDFEMYEKEEVAPEPEPEPTLSTPTGLRATSYQREMDITWDNVSGVNWEVKLDDVVLDTISVNRYVLEKLETGKLYKISVRQIKGKEFSDYATINSLTQAMTKRLDAIDRIPYIRTIREDGTLVGLNMKLYYNDLGNKDAKISYYIDGEKVEPVNNIIKFPKKGIYKFKVIIEESLQAKWELNYRLIVQG